MSLRVIAGSLKNRVLGVPSGLTTRPTGARVRKAVFSILGDLEGLRVLDLYAGSGALGIEALSRGAAFAVLVESERSAVQCIRKNLETLALSERAELFATRTEAAFERLRAGPRFDLVFADPPWAELPSAQKALRRLPDLLVENARLVLEHPAGSEPSIDGLAVFDQRTWGDTGVSFLELAKSAI